MQGQRHVRQQTYKSIHELHGAFVNKAFRDPSIWRDAVTIAAGTLNMTVCMSYKAMPAAITITQYLIFSSTIK